ncbi:MAG: hypothetical protein WCH43_11740 [Verrucomicrobiota bacterium]
MSIKDLRESSPAEEADESWEAPYWDARWDEADLAEQNKLEKSWEFYCDILPDMYSGILNHSELVYDDPRHTDRQYAAFSTMLTICLNPDIDGKNKEVTFSKWRHDLLYVARNIKTIPMLLLINSKYIGLILGVIGKTESNRPEALLLNMHLNLMRELLRGIAFGHYPKTARNDPDILAAISTISRELAPIYLELLEGLYSRTGDPVHVFEAFSLLRSNKTQVPEWILRYFDLCSESFLDICSQKLGEKSPPVFLQAIKFSSGVAQPGASVFGSEGRRLKKYGALVYLLGLRIHLGSKNKKTIAWMVQSKFDLSGTYFDDLRNEIKSVTNVDAFFIGSE